MAGAHIKWAVTPRYHLMTSALLLMDEKFAFVYAYEKVR